jgi:hypothetical protein
VRDLKENLKLRQVRKDQTIADTILEEEDEDVVVNKSPPKVKVKPKSHVKTDPELPQIKPNQRLPTLMQLKSAVDLEDQENLKIQMLHPPTTTLKLKVPRLKKMIQTRQLLMS